MESINVVITTIQRPSIAEMLASLLPQLNDTDFVTLINDSGSPFMIYGLYKHRLMPTFIHLNTPNLGYWGHASRNALQDYLPGDWLMHADDDDTYLPGAINEIRETIKQGNDKLYLFRFKNVKQNVVYWQEIGRFQNNVGTPCGVIPNKPPFPKWGLFYGGDGVFYEELSKRFEPVWIDHVIYEAR